MMIGSAKVAGEVTHGGSSLIGIFLGTLCAFAVDRYAQRLRMRKRARVILRSLAQELGENAEVMQNVRSAYVETPWGKSFYVNTVAWETAVSAGDLPNVIGFELTDTVSAQYGLLVRIRYYVDLLTRLWLAPPNIAGYEEIRGGFNRAILETMNKALENQADVMAKIEEGVRRTRRWL